MRQPLHSPVSISERENRSANTNKKATPKKSGFLIEAEKLSQPKQQSSLVA
jgi:hypothetical protein